MAKRTPAPQQKVQRLSISLPADLAEGLDTMVAERGLRNRSQAVAETIRKALLRHQQEDGDTVMAGTITLFYDAARPGLLAELAHIEREHVDAVISSQHVLLESQFTMEVVLVQGPVRRLRRIKERMLACKGVRSGELTLSSKIMPPVHGH